MGFFFCSGCSDALLWLRPGRMRVFYVLSVQMHYYGSDWVEWDFLCFGCSDTLLWLSLGRMGVFYILDVQIQYYGSNWVDWDFLKCFRCSDALL